MTRALVDRRAFLIATAGLLTFTGTSLAADETPQAFIEALYKAHMPSVSGNAPGVIWTPKLSKRFLTKALIAAIKKDADDSAMSGDVGALDFDPITNSQDPVVEKLAVETVSSSEDKALVRASFGTGGDRRIAIDYEVVKEGGSWRLFDIKGSVEGDAWSLRAILSMK